jgi:hypothetical protein
MKPMTYNRALDYVALALNELTAKKNPVLAARLLAEAAKQPDCQAAIASIEATNRFAKAQADKLAAAAVKANDEQPMPEMPANGESCVEAEFGEDPLDDVEEEEEMEDAAAPAPAMAAKQMAKVLTSMQQRRDGTQTAAAKPAPKAAPAKK